MKNLIAVDIGGTNSRFAHFEVDDRGEIRHVSELKLRTNDASSIEDLAGRALAAGSLPPGKECAAIVLAVPGAVRDNTSATLANVVWAVDVSGLRKRIPGTPVFLINDFVAQAFACPRADRLHTLTVKTGEAQKDAVVAIIGAGTGLGHCALATTDKGGFLPLPSEAGHAAFPFLGRKESEYRDYLLQKTGAEYPYGDMVVSGPGLSHLHAFLTGRELDPAAAAAELTPQSETTELFARFYARACRNYALTVLATGGLFIAGGVAIKNPYLVINDHFRQEFVESTHFGALLGRIPVTLIMSEDSGLWGAANYGVIRLKAQNRT